MAIKRPLCAFASDQLKEMTDAELENLSYNFRVKWAALLKAGHDSKAKYDASVHSPSGTNPAVRGNLLFMRQSVSNFSNPSSNHFNLDGTTINDTRMNLVRTSIADNTTGGAGSSAPGTTAAPDIPATPGALISETVSYNKVLFANFATSLNPGLPTNTKYDDHGYLIWNTGGYIQVDSDASNIVDTILKHSNKEMLDGDEVGTYRVATSAPTDGGSGTWTQIGSGESQAWFLDQIQTYTNPGGTALGSISESTQTAYYLWLKESLTSFSGITSVNQTQPIGWKTSTNSMNRRSIGTNDDLIFQILLPIYRQNPFFSSGNFPGYPRYFHSTSSSCETYQRNRGTFYDTNLDSSSIRDTFGPLNGTYYKERYASGSATTVSTYYLKLSMGDSDDYYRT
tara:strand:- start:1552 stop:2742 length:1191 start_codon:yes stop_codon:yes gene_type:complete